MTDTAEHFVLLDQQSGEVRGSQLLTRSVGTEVAGREILLAVDETRQRHLLVPSAGLDVQEVSYSQGVALGSRILRVGDEDVTFVDLVCRMPALGFVFERLVDAVLVRLESDSSSPLDTCRRVLDEWRALLKVAGQPVTREVVLGLIGELEILRRLVARRPAEAVDAWIGPSGAIHDFARGSTELEVKSTSSIDGNFASISNIDQLDPTLVGQLNLVVVHLRQDGMAPSLDERIDSLLAAGAPRDGLLAKVAGAGYVYESEHNLDDRYNVRSVRVWHVGPTFPGLRRAEIPADRLHGISGIRYDLALDSAPRPLSEEMVDAFFEDWIGPA